MTLAIFGKLNLILQTLQTPYESFLPLSTLILGIGLVALLIVSVYLAILLVKRNKRFGELKLQAKLEKDNQSKIAREAEEAVRQLTDLREIINYQKQQITQQENKRRELEDKIDEEILKRTSELHTALEKTQESNKLKEAFLEKISREIRTPLNAILGFINLLNDPNLSNIDREYYFKFIRESGNNLLVLIDNIVDFVKLETGELLIEERKCNLNLLLNDLVDKYRSRTLRENSGTTILYKKPENDVDALVDCKRVIHVVDQLLNNAVKFTDEGNIEVAYKIEKGKHKISVSDTGIGIDLKYQDIIFERFYQIEPESREVFQGAGLGLTIAKGITDLLGGEISVDSKLGKGTTITVEIPFREFSRDVEKAAKTEQELNWSDKVVLIAEDEDSNFHFLEAILKKTKVNILRAEDGVKFLEIMDTNKNIDLVLLDIKMPGINGFNAIKVVRQQNINIPVIAQTAFNQPEDKQKCLDSGCNDYLAKPIDRELLLAKISFFFNN